MFFRGAYNFLSNAYTFPFKYSINGEEYEFLNAQAAFLACKAPGRAEELSKCNYSEAIAIGKKLKKREITPDFDNNRLSIMESVLRAKFSAPYLKDKLSQVNDEYIKAEVPYSDIYWSVYAHTSPNGCWESRGANHLGQILTKIRDDIREELGMFSLHPAKDKQVLYKIQKHGYVTFDTETTGVSEYDEILQITIVGQFGEVLLSTYVKPENCVAWGEAMEVTGITPEYVEKYGKNRTEVARIVKEIFDSVDVVCGHNVRFDVNKVKSCFGYDLTKKTISEHRAKQEYSHKLKDMAGLVADFVRKIKLGESSASIKKNLSEIEAQYFKAFHDFCLPNSKKRRKLDANLIEDDNRLQRTTLYDIVQTMNPDDDEEMTAIAAEIMPNYCIVDTLEIARKTLKDKITNFSFCENNEENYQLGTLVGNLFPEYYDNFINGAHNAEIDTIYTAMVVDYIAKNYDIHQIFSKGSVVPSNRVENMYGCGRGIFCNIVSTDEDKLSNFSKRIFAHHPEVREKYALTVEKYEKDKLMGKAQMADVAETELKVANIFCENTEQIAEIIGKIALKCPDYSIFVPVITRDTPDGGIEVTEGFGKNGNEWHLIEESLLKSPAMGICLVDTQTGEIFPKKVTADGKEAFFERKPSFENIKKETSCDYNDPLAEIY